MQFGDPKVVELGPVANSASIEKYDLAILRGVTVTLGLKFKTKKLQL